MQLSLPSEISAISYDVVARRMAVCNRNGAVVCFHVEASASLSPVFAVSLPNVVPKALAFGPDHLGSRAILVFSLYDGRMYMLFLLFLSLANLTARFKLDPVGGHVDSQSQSLGTMM